MKVICIKNTAKDLDLKEVTCVLSHEYRFGLIIGREYLVMGIITYKDSRCLYYLIDDDYAPFWYPYLLFEIRNNKLPADWYVQVPGSHTHSQIYSLIGFEELCNQSSFHDALLEREEYALQIYYKRKAEIFDDYFG